MGNALRLVDEFRDDRDFPSFSEIQKLTDAAIGFESDADIAVSALILIRKYFKRNPSQQIYKNKVIGELEDIALADPSKPWRSERFMGGEDRKTIYDAMICCALWDLHAVRKGTVEGMKAYIDLIDRRKKQGYALPEQVGKIALRGESLSKPGYSWKFPMTDLHPADYPPVLHYMMDKKSDLLGAAMQNSMHVLEHMFCQPKRRFTPYEYDMIYIERDGVRIASFNERAVFNIPGEIRRAISRAAHGSAAPFRREACAHLRTINEMASAQLSAIEKNMEAMTAKRQQLHEVWGFNR